MSTEHRYELRIDWTGDRGARAHDYRRTHEIRAAGKPVIVGSSDPAFRGEPDRWNPEELLVASLSQCHLLWYLHLAADAGVVVTAYFDIPLGVMCEEADGAGRFTEVVLRPVVTIADPAAVDTALAVHHAVPAKCFIARSVNFPVRHEPTVHVEAQP